MAEKKYKGAPFGTQTARFDVTGVHPKTKVPGSFTQMPYDKYSMIELEQTQNLQVKKSPRIQESVLLRAVNLSKLEKIDTCLNNIRRSLNVANQINKDGKPSRQESEIRKLSNTSSSATNVNQQKSVGCSQFTSKIRKENSNKMNHKICGQKINSHYKKAPVSSCASSSSYSKCDNFNFDLKSNTNNEKYIKKETPGICSKNFQNISEIHDYKSSKNIASPILINNQNLIDKEVNEYSGIPRRGSNPIHSVDIKPLKNKNESSSINCINNQEVNQNSSADIQNKDKEDTASKRSEETSNIPINSVVYSIKDMFQNDSTQKYSTQEATIEEGKVPSNVYSMKETVQSDDVVSVKEKHEKSHRVSFSDKVSTLAFDIPIIAPVDETDALSKHSSSSSKKSDYSSLPYTEISRLQSIALHDARTISIFDKESVNSEFTTSGSQRSATFHDNNLEESSKHHYSEQPLSHIPGTDQPPSQYSSSYRPYTEKSLFSNITLEEKEGLKKLYAYSGTSKMSSSYEDFEETFSEVSSVRKTTVPSEKKSNYKLLFVDENGKNETLDEFLKRKLGPGTYNTMMGGFSANNVDLKASGPGWARQLEVERLAALPHLLHKEQWEENKMLKRKLGPGSYEIKDFIQSADLKPRSERGICQKLAPRFEKGFQSITPGPGTYGMGGVPKRALEQKANISASTKGMLDAGDRKRNLPSVGSQLGPGTYQHKSCTDEVVNKVTSLKGPYELYSGDRNKPITEGYLAAPKLADLGPGQYEIGSFVDEWKSQHKNMHGKFGKIVQYPEVPTDRIFLFSQAHFPKMKDSPGPGAYSAQELSKPRHLNTPGFLSSAKRDDKMSQKFFTQNFNPVGAGRYDIQKFEEAQDINGHTSVFKSKSGKPNLQMGKFLQERVRSKDAICKQDRPAVHRSITVM